MTFVISKVLQFLAGHRFYVKLTPMSIALYPYERYGFTPYIFNLDCQCVTPIIDHFFTPGREPNDYFSHSKVKI